MDINLYIKAFNKKRLEELVHQLTHITLEAGISFNGPITLPNRTRRFDIMRSPHIDKASRDQFKICVHKRLVKIRSLNIKAIELIMKSEFPAGVEVKVQFL